MLGNQVYPNEGLVDILSNAMYGMLAASVSPGNLTIDLVTAPAAPYTNAIGFANLTLGVAGGVLSANSTYGSGAGNVGFLDLLPANNQIPPSGIVYGNRPVTFTNISGANVTVNGVVQYVGGTLLIPGGTAGPPGLWTIQAVDPPVTLTPGQTYTVAPLLTDFPGFTITP